MSSKELQIKLKQIQTDLNVANKKASDAKEKAELLAKQAKKAEEAASAAEKKSKDLFRELKIIEKKIAVNKAKKATEDAKKAEEDAEKALAQELAKTSPNVLNNGPPANTGHSNSNASNADDSWSAKVSESNCKPKRKPEHKLKVSKTKVQISNNDIKTFMDFLKVPVDYQNRKDVYLAFKFVRIIENFNDIMKNVISKLDGIFSEFTKDDSNDYYILKVGFPKLEEALNILTKNFGKDSVAFEIIVELTDYCHEFQEYRKKLSGLYSTHTIARKGNSHKTVYWYYTTLNKFGKMIDALTSMEKEKYEDNSKKFPITFYSTYN